MQQHSQERRPPAQRLERRAPREADLRGAGAALGPQQVQLGGEHAGEEAGVPRAGRADGEVQDHADRHQDPGTVRDLVQAEEPDEEEHGPSELDGDGPGVRVVPGEQQARAEEVEEGRRLFAPPHELGEDVGLVLWPWRGDAENVPRAGEEQGAPDDGKEETQGSADHGGVDGLYEVFSPSLVKQRDRLFGDHVARNNEEDHDGEMTAREECPDDGQSCRCFVILRDPKQLMAIAQLNVLWRLSDNGFQKGQFSAYCWISECHMVTLEVSGCEQRLA